MSRTFTVMAALLVVVEFSDLCVVFGARIQSREVGRQGHREKKEEKWLGHGQPALRCRQ